MDAPMARALMKKTLDDEVVVTTASGSAHYYVVAIRYTAPDQNA
jgi:transcription elongation factor GreB